jgi:hypothetical protein
MGSKAAEAFIELLASIEAHLKQRGFARRGTVFFREQFGNLGLIVLQKSQKTDAEAVIFTINVGVVSSRLALFFSAPPKANHLPEPSEWHWRQRLGFLLPEGQDKWWTLGPGSNVQQIGDEIQAALDLAVLEIEKHIKDESLRDLWLAGRSPGLTEVQRLKNLLVLVNALGPEERVASTLEDLRRVSKVNAAMIETKLKATA